MDARDVFEPNLNGTDCMPQTIINEAPATISFDQHVAQNNERLATLNQLICQRHSFNDAARELLNWCSDVRAFQPVFEDRLMICLQNAYNLCGLEGFNLDLGYRLLKTCCHYSERLKAEHSALIVGWSSDLAQALLQRPTNPSNTKTALPGTVNGENSNTKPRRAYNRRSSSGHKKQSSNVSPTMYATQTQHANKLVFDWSNMVANNRNLMMSGGNNSGHPAVYPSPTYMPNSQQSMSGYVQYPSAYQQSAQYAPSQPAYASYPQPAASYTHGNDRAMMQGHAQGVPNRPYPTSANGYYPQPSPATSQQLPPTQAQYNAQQNYAAQQRQAQMQQQTMSPNMNGSYLPQEQRTMAAQQTAHFKQQQQMMMQRQVNGNSTMVPMQHSSYSVMEPRYTVVSKDNMLLEAFRLEHNLTVVEHKFYINMDSFTQIMNNPDWDIQLKCFHPDDTSLGEHPGTQWPVYQNTKRISVDVAVNGQPMLMSDLNQPLYIKRLCRINDNTLTFTVHECCCSHFFQLQVVHRPQVKTIMNTIIQRSSLPVEKAKFKLQQILANNAAAKEQKNSKISLLCPISNSRMRVAARGHLCQHYRCFDLYTFLLYNLDKNLLPCPVCKSMMPLTGIEVDEYVTEMSQGIQDPSIHEVNVSMNGDFTLPQPRSCIKTESSPAPMNPNSCPQMPIPDEGNGPPSAKRVKSEPPANWLPPTTGAGVMSPPFVANPYVHSPNNQTQSQSQQRSAVTGRFGPPTPLTPSNSGNPPSVGLPQPIQPTNTAMTNINCVTSNNTMPQQFWQPECSSVAGSAPYTPASVGSAGSHQSHTESNQQHNVEFLPNDIDIFNSDLFTGTDGQTPELLSDSQFRQYLEDSNDLGDCRDLLLVPNTDNDTLSVTNNCEATPDTTDLSGLLSLDSKTVASDSRKRSRTSSDDEQHAILDKLLR